MSWGSGYVTDVAYRAGHYPQQSPWHLAFCATVAGIQADFPGSDDPLCYLELGCGLGMGAIMLAAANPAWRVTAIDFNPAHIAIARQMAAEIGLGNITFLEADLSTLAEDPALAGIPEADVVSMHGVWSWVAKSVQQGIVRLLKARVRPGGLVHVSYNALPAWQGAIGLQRLVREAGLRTVQRSDRQATAGLAVAQELLEANAAHVRQSPIAAGMLERFGKMSTDYLAHELMNTAWAPCFQADVAMALSDARLDFAGTANLTENFPDLTLDAAQRALAARYDDPIMTELIKDMCLERGFRSDIYIRGATRLSSAARDAVLGPLSIGLSVAADRFTYEVEQPVGKVAMNKPFYGKIVAALASGPRRLAELAALPELDDHISGPVEIAGMLLGSEQANLVPRPGAPLSALAIRTNETMVRRFLDTSDFTKQIGMASTALGGGLPCASLDAFMITRMVAAPGTDPEDWATDLGPNLPADQATKLRSTMAARLDENATAWRVAGFR